MKEFDLRVPGLAPIRSGNPANLARVNEVRDLILSQAGGLTEIEPSSLTEMLPGAGMGYIVALKSMKRALQLQAALSKITARWGAAPATLALGSEGPRRELCHFLIPERANPDAHGARRPLFRPEKWAEIESIIRPKLCQRVSFVYGEWLPEGSRIKSTDELRMYVVPWRSPSTETFLRRFLQTRVFDGGVECDQWFLYLSIRGRGEFVSENLQKGF